MKCRGIGMGQIITLVLATRLAMQLLWSEVPVPKVWGVVLRTPLQLNNSNLRPGAVLTDLSCLVSNLLYG